MTVDILIVCAANVCRSPLADALLARALAAAGHDTGIRVHSSGIAVAAPRSACGAIASHARPGPAVELRLRGHVARALQPSDVERADLVLAADRAVRSAIVRGVPRAQSRIFTLRQVSQLADFATVDEDTDPASGVDHAMRRFVADLDMARGLATEDRALRSRGWGRQQVHPHDVPDAHTTGTPHAAVARLLVETVDDVASALLRVLPVAPRRSAAR